jgi:hypothetical protein
MYFSEIWKKIKNYIKLTIFMAELLKGFVKNFEGIEEMEMDGRARIR